MLSYILSSTLYLHNRAYSDLNYTAYFYCLFFLHNFFRHTCRIRCDRIHDRTCGCVTALSGICLHKKQNAAVELRFDETAPQIVIEADKNWII